MDNNKETEEEKTTQRRLGQACTLTKSCKILHSVLNGVQWALMVISYALRS